MARIIEGDIYKAHIEARRIREEAEHDVERILAAGRTLAEQVEGQQVEIGKERSRSEAAIQMCRIFSDRLMRLQNAQDELFDLSLEIVRKILGEPPRLSVEGQREFISPLISEMKKKRILRIQHNNPKASSLNGIGQFDLEKVDDLGPDQLKFICDAGEVVCDSATILGLTDSHDN